jgi:HK97 family phage major capsid protein|nr:MAG TPA: major capsid protein [Caudoviricetes sp.]
MSKEMRELLNKINAKKAEIKALVADGKIEDATSAKEELKDLQKSFDILADLDDDDAQNAQQQAQQGAAQTAAGEKNGLAKQVKAFTNAIKAAWKKTDISPEDKEVLNAMSEGSDEDGGLTVPKDIKTKIKELRRSEDALETLVNVEHVTTNSGSRVIEREADQTPFDNVDEAAEFPDVSTPQFENVDYKIKKKGGILKVTQELLSDTAENIMNYLKKWIAKKAKATRNFMIIAKIKEICKGLEVTVTGLDNLKDIFNVMLDPAIALGAVVVTNQSGFNFLDKLKDEKGNYILQKDPTQATKKLLFGEYPVIKLSNKTLQNIDGKAPIICGDLKEAITIFDRETLTIDISNLVAGMWERDQTGIKVRERLDIQTVDADAVVMGLTAVSTTGTDLNGDGVPDDINGDGEYNEKELNKLTKAEILALAKTKSYTMTKTEEDTKADIIAEFLTQQAG